MMGIRSRYSLRPATKLGYRNPGRHRAEENPGPPRQIADEQGERRWHRPEPRRAEVGRPGTKCKLPGNPERDRAEVVRPADTGRMQQVVPHRVKSVGGLMPDNA